MKNILTLLLIFSFSGLFAQNPVTFVIIDSISKQPVPFVKIIVVGQDKGTYSDEKGFVKIDNLSVDETLLVNNTFYSDKLLPVKNIKKNEQILLSPSPLILNEAIIVPFKEKEIEIGYSKLNPNTNYFNSARGTELTVLIEGKDVKRAVIKSIAIKIKKNPKKEPIVRVHLYQNEKNKPGKEIILKENLLRITDQRNLELNIVGQNYYLPDSGVFVSMEWIGKYYIDGKLYDDRSYILDPLIRIKSASDRKIKGKAFTRTYGEWEPLLTKSQNGNEEYYIPLFGLSVLEHR